MDEKDDPAISQECEFHFTTRNFQRVRELIYNHAGISLGDGKLELVYSRLSRRLRATGLRTFSEYLQLLERGDKDEWESFANSLTTNLTSFFREPHHFPVLAELMRAQKGTHPVVLWCSAASTGEEAYSMAMTAMDTFVSPSPPVTIIATDINTHVLEKTTIGIYPEGSTGQACSP